MNINGDEGCVNARVPDASYWLLAERRICLTREVVVEFCVGASRLPIRTTKYSVSGASASVVGEK